MQTYWANVTLDNARFWLPHLQNGNTERLHDTKHFVFRHDAHAVGLIHWSHQWERLFCCSLRKVIKVSSQNGFKWVFASKNIPVNFQSINLSKAWPTEIKFSGRIWIQSSRLSACGLPRCKQITQPGQTHEVPASNPNGDRANYNSSTFLKLKCHWLWRNPLSIKAP